MKWTSFNFENMDGILNFTLLICSIKITLDNDINLVYAIEYETVSQQQILSSSKKWNSKLLLISHTRENSLFLIILSMLLQDPWIKDNACY